MRKRTTDKEPWKGLSEFGRRLLTEIERRPAITIDSLARRLGTSPATVRRFVTRYLTEGVLVRRLEVAQPHRQLGVEANVGLKFDHRLYDEHAKTAPRAGHPHNAQQAFAHGLAERFEGDKTAPTADVQMQDAYVLLGSSEADVLVRVRARDNDALSDAVAGWIRAQPGVAGTTTMTIVSSRVEPEGGAAQPPAKRTREKRRG